MSERQKKIILFGINNNLMIMHCIFLFHQAQIKFFDNDHIHVLSYNHRIDILVFDGYILI